MSEIQIKTYNEILGAMIRKVIADSPLNDINTGSVLLTLLEAAASNDFENNAAMLNILDLLNINALKDSNLDARAGDFGLERITAKRASGFVTISDSSITKRSTSFFQVRPAPITGDTTIYINSATGWDATGDLYVGRGTSRFEGPISYSSLVDNGTFFTVTLDSALQNDHLLSDAIVDKQGTADRLVGVGTTIKIPANNQNPEISYTTLREAVIPAGEDIVSGIAVRSVKPGSLSNAGINTITKFNSTPFTNATVTNSTAFIDGRDVESDDELRERLKLFTATLSRGTEASILSSIVGISDADEAKQVASAVIEEPISAGDPSTVFIDDGTGFQPSFSGQSVDPLITDASGKEEFLQLANFPLPRPQIVNTVDGPFEISDGMQLRVIVDEIEEIVQFATSDFLNASSATLAEIVVAINNRSSKFNCRLSHSSTRLLLYTSSFDAETLQVADNSDPLLDTNSLFKFPTAEVSYIRLYKNNVLLHEQVRAASVTSVLFGNWNVTLAGNLQIEVDGTPAQDRGFTTQDFGGVSFASLSLSDWVTAINTKFAGLTASETSDEKLELTSNKTGSASSVKIVGGSYKTKMFTSEGSSGTGKDADFQLNRQNGNIRILNNIAEGDIIEAGTADAKGNVVTLTANNGAYQLSADTSGRDAVAVMVPDASVVLIRDMIVASNSAITISDQGSNTMRLLVNNAVMFKNIHALDYVYVAYRNADANWLSESNTGIFRVVAKGEHTSDGINTWIEVQNYSITAETKTVQSAEDVVAFTTDGIPQVWNTTELLATPSSATIQSVVDSIRDDLVGIKASTYRTNFIKITSTTENSGSIAVPVVIGNATRLFDAGVESQFGNTSHIGNMLPQQDLMTYFRITPPTNTNIWLGRYTYSGVSTPLTSASLPGTEGADQYAEILSGNSVLNNTLVSYDDVLKWLSGSNKGQDKPIRHIFNSGDQVGTQYELPNSSMLHSVGEDIGAFKTLQISPDDSAVLILDQDATAKTIDVQLSRTGRINSGSGLATFSPTTTAFSADDSDNAAGVDFADQLTWSTTANNTNFSDYSVWFKARNWYVTGGVGSGGAAMMLRSNEWGPVGENLQFQIEYPTSADQDKLIQHVNTPTTSLVTYAFGSGTALNLALTNGTEFQAADQGSGIFRLQFVDNTPAIPWPNLIAVQVGDILTVGNDNGVSAGNIGTYRVTAVDDANHWVEIYNPNGVNQSATGAIQETTVTAVDNVGGVPAQHSFSVVDSASLDGTYFILYDQNGSVAFWYDVDNSGTTIPAGAQVANRAVQIDGVLTGHPDTTVAALTSAKIALDSQFSTSAVAGITFTITDAANGARLNPIEGDSGFTITQTTTGVDDNRYQSEYFLIADQNGKVAVWYNIANGGTRPVLDVNRYLEVTTVTAGMSAADIAIQTRAVINADAQFTAPAPAGAVITITDILLGERDGVSAGSLDPFSFTVTATQIGANADSDVLTNVNLTSIYPITDKDLTTIVTTINESEMMNAAAINSGALEIELATRDEVYTPAGAALDFTTSLSYGHNPDPISGFHSYVPMYDGSSWVKYFQNSNPNFVLKADLLLPGAVSSTIYAMDTTVNADATVGEEFKLIPRTLNNIHHHFTQKALSQMPIVSDVEIADNNRNIQIKSKILGSGGSIELVGGEGNASSYSVSDDALVTSQNSIDYMSMRIQAFPSSLNVGDYINLANPFGVDRLTKLVSTDSIDTVKNIDNWQYQYNHKEINTNPFVGVTITDVSATTSHAAETVWRWQHEAHRYIDMLSNEVSTLPFAPVANDVSNLPTTRLQIFQKVVGSTTVAQRLYLAINAVPVNGDFFYLQDQGAAQKDYVIHFRDTGAGVPTIPVTGDFNIQVNYTTGQTVEAITISLDVALAASGEFGTTKPLNYSQRITGFGDVIPGDLLMMWGSPAGWDTGNMVEAAGTNVTSGFPIVAVGADYVDVVNPYGVAMATTDVGVSGLLEIVPSPIIEWKIGHKGNTSLVDVVASSGTATATTTAAHRLRVGDSFVVMQNDSAAPNTLNARESGIVLTTPTATTFTYSTTAADNTYAGGAIQGTRYRLESYGYNDLMRLTYIDGPQPLFANFGVAVDDKLSLSGSTLATSNNGSFKVLGVTDTEIIFQNSAAQEEVHTYRDFNGASDTVTWTETSDTVTGIAGRFLNVRVGDWVKKPSDADSQFRQVTAVDNADPALVTAITLGSTYSGTTGDDAGLSFDQNDDVRGGVALDAVSDIKFFEGDSIIEEDQIYVEEIVSDDWFDPNNSGTFTVKAIGTTAEYKPYIEVENLVGLAESNRLMSVKPGAFKVIEGFNNRLSTIKRIEHIAIDSADATKRIVSMFPADRAHKWNRTNQTVLSVMGKLDMPTSIATGVDGYTYYTGLLRTVQRVIDGFEPDPITYPGQKAIGSVIELLPPLISAVSLSISVTTKDGIELNDISQDIKSIIVQLINTLDVGEDVVLADVIVKIKRINGVKAVTFVSPEPTNESISVADNEKAFIEASNINIS